MKIIHRDDKGAWQATTRAGDVYLITEENGVIVVRPEAGAGAEQELQEAVDQAAMGAYGDSNDTEIEALGDALELALTRWPSVKRDDDRPCPCGKSHTIAEHGYDPDDDDEEN